MEAWLNISRQAALLQNNSVTKCRQVLFTFDLWPKINTEQKILADLNIAELRFELEFIFEKLRIDFGIRQWNIWEGYWYLKIIGSTKQHIMWKIPYIYATLFYSWSFWEHKKK